MDIFCICLFSLFTVFLFFPLTKITTSLKAGTVPAMVTAGSSAPGGGPGQGRHLLNIYWMNELVDKQTVRGMGYDSFFSSPIYFQIVPSESLSKVYIADMSEYVVDCKWQETSSRVLIKILWRRWGFKSLVLFTYVFVSSSSYHHAYMLSKHSNLRRNSPNRKEEQISVP